MSFEKDALATCSREFHGELVTRVDFVHRLYMAIKALQKLDHVKKALFYGRRFDDLAQPNELFTGCGSLPASLMEHEESGEAIIHGILGMATESGELLELLHKTICDSSLKFDVVNMCEEIGDTNWYEAVLADVAGKSIDEMNAAVIAKLRARYPEKFTAHDAINRDLDNERQVLERNL